MIFIHVLEASKWYDNIICPKSNLRRFGQQYAKHQFQPLTKQCMNPRSWNSSKALGANAINQLWPLIVAWGTCSILFQESWLWHRKKKMLSLIVGEETIYYCTKQFILILSRDWLKQQSSDGQMRAAAQCFSACWPAQHTRCCQAHPGPTEWDRLISEALAQSWSFSALMLEAYWRRACQRSVWHTPRNKIHEVQN